MQRLSPALAAHLRSGVVIPAHPLALTADLQLDERSQRALTRYYCAAGAGGIAVGVHTTQFEIHDPDCGLLPPVLALASTSADEALAGTQQPFIKVAGLVGDTAQAVREARLAVDLGYHIGLVSLAGHGEADDVALLNHCRAIAAEIPLFGFYLQPSVGGRYLSYEFWRAFAELDNVVAIKIAPFNRYYTLDVVRGVVDAGRAHEIALYTGNDDNIVADLLTDYSFTGGASSAEIVGGLLGQWAVWTHQAVDMLAQIKAERVRPVADYARWLRYGVRLTDANAAIFDVANGYRGCIPGINYLLARQGLIQGPWSLNPHECLSPGQVAEIERICGLYPELQDDEFVSAHLADWLA